MSHIPIASIRFAGDLSLWTVLPILVVAILIVLFLYQRETKTLASPYAWLLPALRATSVALVVLILAGPVWHRRQVIGTLGRVVFAIDTSRSMALSDSHSPDGRANRLQRASQLLTGTASEPGWLEQIRQTHVVDVIAFDEGQATPVWSSDSDKPLPNSLDLVPEGQATDLSSPLAAVLASINLDAGDTDEGLESVDSVRRSAIVLMTDGQDNATGVQNRSARSLAKQLSVGGTNVVTMGLGTVDEPPDVGIVEVRRPETVAREGRLAGEIVMKQFGEGTAPVSLRIQSQGQTVWERQLAAQENGIRSVPFEIDVQEIVDRLRSSGPRGIDRTNEVLRLTATVETSRDDYTDKNNAVEFRVAASTRDRRLLIVDGSSRWETRYLKNLFVRDPAWNADVVVFGPGTENAALPRGNADGQFPSTDAEMSAYDAVIVGEIDPSLMAMEDRGRLMRFVAGGGGLIVIDGRFGKLRGLTQTEFGELMPIRYSSATALRQPLGIRPTTLGIEQPALALIDSSAALKQFWTQLPAPSWAANVELAEGAEGWASAIVGGAQSTPWLATRMYGSGRVFYLASDQTWRWRYKVADRFHAKFWNQLVIAAMEPPYSASDQFVALGTDKIEYESGSAVEVRTRLRDGRGNPVADATVDAMVMRNGIVIASVPMTIDQPQRGTYRGSILALPPGEYSVRIRASGFDETALLASTPFWINENQTGELRRMSLNQNTLQEIASAGQGEYFHESDASGVLGLLKPMSSGTVIETDTVLWQSYFWFCPIITLLGIEWWCRKRAGLV
ncbi:hypothetical protein [Roseiconus lacunae]|uniref:VWFA domain-containing protein n=1 Tax=Roseiconus lacunae TaxID=2605694 RepID=A0ABT7PNG0_9BACT|nr:hypothetical protein [Roseiconus lacunae]MDM4018018.1 hypothetical protein [Roseiconus lacunae]